MKKMFLFVMLLFLSVNLSAQIGVTRFLDIPIDGAKSEMIQKLKAKGFTSNPYDNEVLDGEFNGRNVHLHIVTNKNKVYRIMVADANYTDETDIKIRFQNLALQFIKNGKYMLASENVPNISNEDIGYEISINNKRYEMAFYQLPTGLIEHIDSLKKFLLTKFTEDILNSPTEEQQLEIELMEEQFKRETVYKNLVWYTINKKENEDKYSILIYYDNKRNQANGEDL